MQLRIAALVAVSLVMISCRPVPHFVSWGNSIAVDHFDAIADVTGCDATLIGERGKLIACSDTFCNQPSMFDTLDEDLEVLASLPGPVFVVLQAGHGDEVIPQVGLTPEEVAYNATVLIDAILFEREDVFVVHLSGPGTCFFTYNEFLPDFGPRYRYVELPRIDDDPSLFRDSCHPNHEGALIRIEDAKLKRCHPESTRLPDSPKRRMGL